MCNRHRCGVFRFLGWRSCGSSVLHDQLYHILCSWPVLSHFTKYEHTISCSLSHGLHDDVIKWKHFPRYWPFVRGIHRSTVNSPHKGQWRGALMFTLICARINGWVNNREAGDLRRYRAHYDVIVMWKWFPCTPSTHFWPYYPVRGLYSNLSWYIRAEKMADILQATFSNSFFLCELLCVTTKSLPTIQLWIIQHWSR